jgi:DNA-directed RNA polymerase subunit RPC12/RpoP
MKCYNCQKEVSFWRRFLINISNDKYLPCPNCNVELVRAEFMLLHTIISSSIFGALLFFKDKLIDVEVIMFSVVVLIPTLYFYLFIPLRKS